VERRGAAVVDGAGVRRPILEWRYLVVAVVEDNAAARSTESRGCRQRIARALPPRSTCLGCTTTPRRQAASDQWLARRPPPAPRACTDL